MTEPAEPQDQGAEVEQPATGGDDWQTLFEGEDPAKVRQALDHARTWQARAQENYEKAKQFDAYQEAQKSEQQKLEERLSRAEAEASKASIEQARLAVALEKGLTPSQARRLIGTTAEELAADADVMLEDLSPGKPRGDIAQGARHQAPITDMNQIIRQAAGLTG